MGEAFCIVLGLAFLIIFTKKVSDVLVSLARKPLFRLQRFFCLWLFKYLESGFLIYSVSILVDFSSNPNDEEFRIVSEMSCIISVIGFMIIFGIAAYNFKVHDRKVENEIQIMESPLGYFYFYY